MRDTFAGLSLDEGSHWSNLIGSEEVTPIPSSGRYQTTGKHLIGFWTRAHKLLLCNIDQATVCL